MTYILAILAFVGGLLLLLKRKPKTSFEPKALEMTSAQMELAWEREKKEAALLQEKHEQQQQAQKHLDDVTERQEKILNSQSSKLLHSQKALSDYLRQVGQDVRRDER